tara:strand:- start:58 stop:1410 length:1353 start_codon:yes stop_codon:yes gene_type:complete
MQIANAGKQLNAPTAGVQKVVNADGTVTEIPYQEDRFGRRTVMTSQGPQVLPGHEGKDAYGDLGGKIGNVLGGLINKGRLGRQERIAEKSVAEQELASPTFAGAKDFGRAPYVPTNQAELEKARERLNYKTPQEKINYFDMSTVQSSVKPSALQEKLNIYLPAGVTYGGRTVNGVKTSIATQKQLQEAMGKIKAATGSATTYHTPARFKDGSFSTSNNAGGLTYTDKKGNSFDPGDKGYADAVAASVESGLQYASDLEFRVGQSGQRTEDLKNIRSSIAGVRQGQNIYGKIADAVDDGAITGPFAKFFPTWQAATTELENLQKQLGLNLIQNTTFGALSESELKFALDTAMPPFRGPRLKEWALEKQRTQKLLIAYLYDMSQYISSGEGTAQDFETKKYIEQQRNLTLNDTQESSDSPPSSTTNAESDIPELEFQSTVDPATKEAFLNAS